MLSAEVQLQLDLSIIMFANLRKGGSIRNCQISGLISTEDPEQRFTNLYEIGHGSFGAVYYVSLKEHIIIMVLNLKIVHF